MVKPRRVMRISEATRRWRVAIRGRLAGRPRLIEVGLASKKARCAWHCAKGLDCEDEGVCRIAGPIDVVFLGTEAHLLRHSGLLKSGICLG